MSDWIQIKNAHANNLKNFDLRIPKNRLVVITGLSGSGKSSIAFDIIDNESRRQYMESLGLITDGVSKAKCDWVKGLPPSISIQQHLNNKNPRSTVGTVTELYTYIRLLYAKLGKKNGINEGWFMADFSFNKPNGACPQCTGLGKVNEVDLNSLVDFSKSIADNAVKEWDIHYIQRNTKVLVNAANYYQYPFDINDVIADYHHAAKAVFLYGTASQEVLRLYPGLRPPKTASEGRFEGIIANITRRYSEKANSKKGREKLMQYFRIGTCPSCHGMRLKSAVRDVQVADKTIVEVQNMSINELNLWLSSVSSLPQSELKIAEPIISDLASRIKKLQKVNVGYLGLIRSIPTLSNGEAQRLKIANLLSSGLSGVLYILDEPTKGLHGRDIDNMLSVLVELKNQGNHLILIEHSLAVISNADYVIDMGPGSGQAGGQVIAAGRIKEITDNSSSWTGRYLKEPLVVKENLRTQSHGMLVYEGVNLHNVCNQTVKIPLNNLIGVAGVSGSGKSTIFIDAVARDLKKYYRQQKDDQRFQHIKGLKRLNGIRVISQKTVGRSSRSNPATYTGIYDKIRGFYARLSSAVALDLKPSHFSFNTAGGRCETCQGKGFITTKMHFLPDVRTACPACAGKRFNSNVLQVEYKGVNISEVLNQTIDEALDFFKGNSKITAQLNLLSEVGLGYLQLGQEFSTLSGGEAQRIKLAKDLIDDNSFGYLYIMDEPSSGLHCHDSLKLINLLQKIVDRGNTVIVIEHNPQFLLAVDHIIEVGPGSGKQGGKIIFTGNPSEIIGKDTPTGRYINSLVSKQPEVGSHDC